MFCVSKKKPIKRQPKINKKKKTNKDQINLNNKMNTINVEARHFVIICNQHRCKVRSCYFHNLITFFKTIKGWYYDNSNVEWSFPIENLESIKNFLTATYFPFKEIDGNFLARLYKSAKEIQMGFDCFQQDFSIFKEIEESKYDREMMRYIVPIEKFEQLKHILIKNKYNFLINEDKTSSLIFQTNSAEAMQNHKHRPIRT